MILRHKSLLMVFFTLAFMILESGCTLKSSLKFSDLDAARNANRAPASEYEVVALVAPRGYVESVLIQAFAVPPTDSTTLNLIKDNVYLKGEFGGECDPYAAGEDNAKAIEFPREICSDSKGLTLDGRAVSTPARYALIAQVCETLVGNSARFDSAMSQVIPGWSTLQIKPSPDAASIILAYQLFHRVDLPSDKIISALIETGKTGANNTEAWKSVVTNICVSPSWQFH